MHQHPPSTQLKGLDLELEAQTRCLAAKQCEEVRDFARAIECLGPLWEIGKEDIETVQLSAASLAEILLRKGALIGRTGNAQGRGESREEARAHIQRALLLFQGLGETTKCAEALIELSINYWRSGETKEARSLLNDPTVCESANPVIQARRLYNLSLIAFSERQFHDALSYAEEALPYYANGQVIIGKSRFFSVYADAQMKVGEKDGRTDLINEALYNYTLSSQLAEETGNSSQAAITKNNVGFLFYLRGRYAEALEHLNYAVKLFARLGDLGRVAQTTESIARVLLAQKDYTGAERLVSQSITHFEKTGENDFLAEALVTRGTARMYAGNSFGATSDFKRSAQLYELNGHSDKAADAHLTYLGLARECGNVAFNSVVNSLTEASRLLALCNSHELAAKLKDVQDWLAKSADFKEKEEQAHTIPEEWASLTLSEARALLDEEMLCRALLKRGTLTGAAAQLGLTVEGVRHKLKSYPQLQKLFEALKQAQIVPLTRHRKSQEGADRGCVVWLDAEDDYLSERGPAGGDALNVEPCGKLSPGELGAISVEGTAYVGYYSESGGRGTLYSGVLDLPPQPFDAKSVVILGRVTGYWKAEEYKKPGAKLRPLLSK